MQPHPKLIMDTAFEGQFLAQAVQLVQSQGRAIIAGPVSGSSQTLNGQTSMHMPHLVHADES